ncbi:unnamed protein product [Spirodela intermedia]|uniref:Myb-like domain-containing protein n=1 Tax=Spirodela intermedia TaxID=51605 RepID=A0A7I8JQY8_SPIIN|nr:unnamed protein product [Spirodela intermedia]CAA6671852.1 unnamed protein product [Spirodela intermedia]
MAAAEVTGEEKAREYRKGNWTLEETMSLIEAKSMDKERRTKRVAGGGGPSELRWKWVEDYCWKMGCHRSQNQCNDKWDNLMRDYKKVRATRRRRRPAAVPAALVSPTGNSTATGGRRRACRRTSCFRFTRPCPTLWRQERKAGERLRRRIGRRRRKPCRRRSHLSLFLRYCKG